MPKVKRIPLEKLKEDPMNVRSEPNIDTKLVDDIKKGQIEPLVVRPEEDSDKYLVTVGSRRFTAAENAGLEALDCKVREDLEGEDYEAMCLSARENAGSEELPDEDWRGTIKKAIEEKGEDPRKEETVREIAEELGLSRRVVKRYIETLKLEESGFGWVLDPDEEEIPPEVSGLSKEHSERSEEEKKALEEELEENSEDVPCVVEDVDEVDSIEDVRELGQRAKAKLSENLNELQELPLEEQVKAIAEVIAKGHSSVSKALKDAKDRADSEEGSGKGDRRSPPKGHEVKIKLSDRAYQLLMDYADFKGVVGADRAAENIVVKFLRDEVLDHPRITKIQSE